MLGLETNIKYKYPDYGDLKLQKKIALKKEFKHPYNVPKRGIVPLDKKNKICQQEEFTLSPHQEFVKNFIHPNTSYNGLLLYHGMGTGKTCTAIGVTEQFRELHKYNPNFKNIWIIASANVQDNFKLQLFDPDKLTKENGVWELDSCVGPNLLQELQNYDLQNMTKDMITRKIQKNINKHYQFLGYEKFANLIMNIMQNIHVSDEKKAKRIIKERLNQEFGNSLLVIDEAHNIRLNGNENNKKIAKSIQLLTTYVKKNKMLLLTGTPMYNDSQEIVFLLNVLRSNDGLSAIKKSEVFDKSGDILIGEDGQEIGKQNLTYKANGYVSFVRGENPYIFPFKIYPRDYESPNSVFHFEYPRIQYNGMTISQGIQFLDLYVSKMSEFQKEGYKYFTHKMNRVSKNKNGAEEDGEEAAASGYKEFQEAIYSLNICYPGTDGQYLNGKNGLYSVVSRDDNYKYRYINAENGLFDYETIGTYSAKIKEILDMIINSEGIILIYSQYKDAGLIPIALALEELGMSRISSSDNLFSGSGNRKGKQAMFHGKYSMITGDVNYSKNNSKEIKVINKEENKDGSLCKVVLITQAGSEGIDFKNLRQVHILEPWYNLNRMDQIVGRAIRNCSHKDLPLSKRNCQIFMHGSYVDENEEMIDLFLYRRCEDKARKIGKIQSILKSISVDCIVHENQKEFSKMKEKLAKIVLSTKNVINNFAVKDKPYSLVCDYQEECNYTCHNESTLGKEDISTYSYSHTVKNQLIEQIKRLFLKRHVYTFEEILELFEINKNSPEKIYSALTYLVNSNTEIVSDKFGKQGTVMNVKNLYVFQPLEFNDSYTTLYDKMRPLKHKPSMISVTKPTPKIVEEKSALIDKTLGVSSTAAKNTSSDSSNRLLKQMETKFEIGMKTNGELKDKHKDFFMNYSLVVDKLNELLPDKKIDTTSKKKWLIEHLVETVPFKKELSLVNYLFREDADEMTQFGSLIKDYYKKNLVFSFLKGKLLFLIDMADKKSEIGDKLHLYDSHIKLYYKANDESKFRLLTQSEKQDGQARIIRILQKSKVDQSKVSKYLTFMGHYEKDKKEPIQLKIKRADNAQKNKKNKGRVFKNELPKDMFPVLNEIIGANIIVPKIFIKEQLTLVLELISKHFSDKDKTIYMNKLQSAENNIEEL